MSNSGLTAVTTKKLNDEAGYQTTVAIDDALLRLRQTQSITPQGGRLVSDTFYDSRGWTTAIFTGWWDPNNTPSTTLATTPDLAGQAPVEDYYVYDGLGTVATSPQELGGYTYAADNPTTNTDPTGLYPICDGPCHVPPRTTSSGGGGGGSTYYHQAEQRYFSPNPPPNAIRHFFPRAAPIADHGIVVVRFFIPERTAIPVFNLLGDDRGFSIDPNASYRIALAWNTAIGAITYTVSPSTIDAGDYLSCPSDQPCNRGRNIHVLPARPFSFTTWQYGIPNRDNNATTHKCSGQRISFDYHGLQPLLPVFSVDGHVDISFNGNNSIVHTQGDDYPNMEVNQYRPNGSVSVLARSAHGALGGLDAAPGVGPRDETWVNGSLVDASYSDSNPISNLRKRHGRPGANQQL